MNYLIPFALILILASSAKANGPEEERTEVVTAPPRDLPKDPAIIMDTLFGKIPLEEPLNEKETLELLKNLLELHKDAIPEDQLKQVEYLYSVSQMDQSKCDEKSFEKLRFEQHIHRNLKATIAPYLTHYKEQLWEDVCRTLLQEKVAQIVDNYDKEIMRDLYLLTNIEINDKLGTWESFADNVATFIRYKLDENIDEKELQDKEKFLKLYRETIDGVCGKPMKDLGPLMDIYDSVFPVFGGDTDGKSAKQKADYLINRVRNALTMWWISTIRICREIASNDSHIISDDAQQLLTGPQPFGQKIKSFFDGMFKPKQKN